MNNTTQTEQPKDRKPVIAWWSGGVTSAVACKIAIDQQGKDGVRVILIDTYNEDADTYRFLNDCRHWYGVNIERIHNDEYESIEEVWGKFKSLNVANGAICSAELKRKVRQQFQNKNDFSVQVFGFDCTEVTRARNMKRNYPDSRPIFPLIRELMDKKDCIKYLQVAGVEIPRTYQFGFQNNNCFNTGCVQGGIGYWQKIAREFPDKFERMAKIEHDLTDQKGQPVTMLKDQGKAGGLVFLKPHPNYPHIKDISVMKGREPEPLTECNGFCETPIKQPKK